MGKLKLPIFGTEIVYDNPRQVDQNTLKFGTDVAPYNNVVPGGVWQPNYGQSIPQPGTYEEEALEPESNRVQFNKQPAPLSSGGIRIPNTTVVFRNPA